MERILSEIRFECENQLQEEMVQYCGPIIDSIHKNIDAGIDEDYLQLILQLFKICVESNVPKLHLLSIDLLKIYIRQTSESNNDSIKEYTITQILRQCCNIFNKSGSMISFELLGFIIEIAATFGTNLTINHVIDIIELCQKQIKEYVLKDAHQSVFNRASFRNFFSNNKISSENKVFSAIYLTSGQVCHYFVKNKIVNYKNASNGEENSKTSQDFIFLTLYLIKKLETKVNFFCEVDWEIAEKNGDYRNVSKNEAKVEIFILIKTINCFYLKCIHFILLAIPDAWKHMTSQLMEVIWKYLAPVLVHILNPISTISSNSVVNSKHGITNNDSNNYSQNKTQTFFGRGSEKLHLNLPINSSNHTLNSLNYQERQHMYKISLELLRLFGLESSMRPMLEALFYRIFLLPPLNQRLDSLVYMQEIFKNPILVLILISDPICLFGPSVSNSQYLDLFQIFMDAIKEASLWDDVLLNQLSLASLATLLNTIRNITNLIVEKNITENETKLIISSSPIFKMISSYLERNWKLFEESIYRTQNATGFLNNRLSKYNSQNNRFNISFIKDRIYGYETMSPKPSSYPVLMNEKNKVKSKNQKNGCPYDFDYQNKLNALISSESSSTSENNYFKNMNTKKQQMSISNKKLNECCTLKIQSFHLSLEDIRLGKRFIDFDLNNLRFTNSDSKLNFFPTTSYISEEADIFTTNYYHSSESSGFDISKETFSNEAINNIIDEDDEENDFSNIKFTIPKMFEYSKRCKNDQSNQFFERLLANIFIRKLSKMIPELINSRNLFAVDESLQLFSSKFCKDLYINLNLLIKCSPTDKLIDLEEYEIEKLRNYMSLYNNLFINADGIYLATYLTMLLNLKLLYSNYYENDSKDNIPISEKVFIDDIFNYHITIYLSQKFLAEIYQNVLSRNLFQCITEEFRSDFNKLPLIKFLLDIDILDRNNPDAFKLSHYLRLEQMAHINHGNQTTLNNVNFKPLNLLLKRFAINFWDPILLCLRESLHKKLYTFQNMVQLIDSYNVTYISSICLIFNCESKHSLAQSKNTNITIQIILMLFDICDNIGFYNRMDIIYELLYQYIIKFWNRDEISSNEIKNFNLKKSFPSNDLNSFDQSKDLTLSYMQIFALKTLLTNPTRIGSHCPRIWKNVFDLCRFIIDVENFIFRSSRSSLLSRARVSINTILKSNSLLFGADFDTNLHVDHYQNLYDHHNAFTNFPGINEAEYSNFEQHFDNVLNEIKYKKIDLGPDSKYLEQIIEYLLLLVSQIFESIPHKCNLSLLNNFINELCDYSKMQLMKLNEKNETSLSSSSIWSNHDSKSLMLFRLVEIILRFVRNGRPLLHFMKIWPSVSSHLVYASTHKECNISKKAITSLHDIINAFFTSHAELDFFNFNESLFKPYEKLLRFEMCNSESQQELILCSICEFVEGAFKEVRSGWKSIFKALKGLRLSIDDSWNSQSKFNCTHHIQILTDTFEAFLRTDNMHVLAYASIEFIPCIFYLIRNFSSKRIDRSITEYQNEVFIIFLKCVQKFAKILRSINDLSEDSFINFQVRLKKTRLIDVEKIKTAINNIDLKSINIELYLSDLKESKSIDRDLVTLSQIRFMFVDEYALTICSSHLEFRSMLLQVYLTLVPNMINMNDTVQFSLYCFNHIDLPMMQCMLRETIENEQIDEFHIFLKNWLQVFDNHIIKFMLSHSDDLNDYCEPFNLLLQQLLLIYLECLNGEYHDLIANLSLSLVKHILLSLYPIFTPELWKIVINYFKIAHQFTIHPLKSLVNSFLNLPPDLNSDLQQIKIMSTRNNHTNNISSLNYVEKQAHQIFFVDAQPNHSNYQKIINNHQTSHFGENYLHSIIVETSSGIQKSISYNIFINQLHNHLTLLEIISSILTFNIKPDITDLVSFSLEDEICSDQLSSNKLIPLLCLQSTQYNDLCFFLKQSFTYAMKFDSRPGLKYLLRHLCHSNSIPNLYQISSLVWSTQFAVNFFLCSNSEYRNEESLSALEELFNEIVSIYIEKMNMSQKVLMNHKSKKIDSPLIIKTDDDENKNHFKFDSEKKSYQLVSPEKVSKLLEEYRKNKSKQEVNLTKHISDSNKQIGDQTKQDGSEFFQYDLDNFINLWNDIINKCIRMHIDCDMESFCFMLLQYQQLIGAMIKHSFDSNSHETVLSWINKLSNQLLTFNSL